MSISPNAGCGQPDPSTVITVLALWGADRSGWVTQGRVYVRAGGFAVVWVLWCLCCGGCVFWGSRQDDNDNNNNNNI